MRIVVFIQYLYHCQLLRKLKLKRDFCERFHLFAQKPNPTVFKYILYIHDATIV